MLGNRKIHKITVASLICVILSLIIINPAFATSIYDSEYEVDAVEDRLGTVFTGLGNIAAGNDEYLSSVRFKIYNQSAATGSLICKVWNIDDLSAGAFLEESTKVTLSSTLQPGVYTWVNFSFADTTLLDSFEVYLFAWIVNDTVTNAFTQQYDAMGTGSWSYTRYGSTWNPGAARWVWELWTDGEEGAGGETNQPWQYDNTDELINNFAEFIVPVAVMLLPAILFIIFFRKTDKWLILIGLAIGTGLGYYFGMVPVWLVFLVAIGLIGLAYSEVRRNG